MQELRERFVLVLKRLMFVCVTQFIDKVTLLW